MEWTLNPQYEYGVLVPFLTVYLVYLRWDDRPLPGPPSSDRTGKALQVMVFACVLVLWPLKWLLGANPDWRPLLWVFGASCFVFSLAALWLAGGARWLRHFWVPFVLMLLAVPWPSPIEHAMTGSLMSLVAEFTLQAAHLLGIYAERAGNVIVLSKGMVGVEEACSGIRSFQSSLMVAFFLGELQRMKFRERALLLAVALAIAMVLNLARTLTLTLITAWRGPESFASLHDTVGGVILVLNFLSIVVAAWALNGFRVRMGTDSGTGDETGLSPDLGASGLTWLTCLVVVIGILLPYPLVEAWYRAGSPDTAASVSTIDWDRAMPGNGEMELSEDVRGLLRFSEGTARRWKSPAGMEWQAYFFYWGAGRISSFAGIHNPRTCLPSAGFRLVEAYRPILWESEWGTIEFSFERYSLSGYQLYVMFGVWDEHAERQIPMLRGPRERWEMALAGVRITGRYSLEVVLGGHCSADDAREALREFLARGLAIEPIPSP